MSGCSDKRFERMLYAYELGMLSDEERSDFEIHLLECNHCFERTSQFNDVTAMIRYDPVVHDAIHKMAAEQADEPFEKDRTESRRPFRWKIWPALVRPSVVVAAVLILLIFKPWKIEFHPTQEAIAARNRIAVLYFGNLAEPEDPDHLGEIATNLLITDLSESPYLQVLSSQRIDDLLKLLGREGTKTIDRNTASQIAKKAEAKWILEGSILQVKPSLLLTTQLIEASSGNVAASTRITGNPGESIFTLVDKTTVEIKKHLSLPETAREEHDRLVADVTTHSAEAYRYYLEGVDYYNKIYFPEAIASFENAVKYDSTFASAYYYLAKLYHGLDAYLSIKKAVQYMDNTVHKEKQYIKSLDAWYSRKLSKSISILQQTVRRYPDEKEAFHLLGNYHYAQSKYEEAVQYFNEVIKIDPFHKTTYNMLAYSYDRLGNLEKSLWAINKYISIASNEANPYDTRGEIYANNGMLNEAIESFEQALEIKPDFSASLLHLGTIHLFKREYTKAENYFQSFISMVDENRRPSGRLYLAFIPIHQGKLSRALEVLDDGIGADRLEITRPTSIVEHAFKFLAKARIYSEIDKPDSAVNEFERYMEIHMKSFPGALANFWNFYIQLLAENKDFEKAEKSTEELKNFIEYYGAALAPYFYAFGCIEFEKGHPNESVSFFEEAYATSSEFPLGFMLARAYQESDRIDEAINIYNKLISSYTTVRAFYGIWNAKTHYHLGLLYEKSGEVDKAIEQYTTFLDIWKDADPEIKAINDAKKRLADLETRLGKL